MDGTDSPALQAIFRVIVARRFWFVAFYALLLPVAVAQALRVESDNSIARLNVWRALLQIEATRGDIQPFLQAVTK